MRVIAGKYRSRPLHSMRGMEIRPTSDRLRETLFNVLTAGNPAALSGSVWIDLFAGTGAVGIEALSRGAARVYCVESELKAAKVIRQNLAALAIGDGFEVLECDAAVGLKRLATNGVKANYVFLDPPYRMHEAYAKLLTALGGESSLLAEGGLVIAEHEKKFDPGEEFGALRRSRKLKQGDAGVSFYRIPADPY